MKQQTRIKKNYFPSCWGHVTQSFRLRLWRLSILQRSSLMNTLSTTTFLNSTHWRSAIKWASSMRSSISIRSECFHKRIVMIFSSIVSVVTIVKRVSGQHIRLFYLLRFLSISSTCIIRFLFVLSPRRSCPQMMVWSSSAVGILCRNRPKRAWLKSEGLITNRNVQFVKRIEPPKWSRWDFD